MVQNYYDYYADADYVGTIELRILIRFSIGVTKFIGLKKKTKYIDARATKNEPTKRFGVFLSLHKSRFMCF